MKSKTRTIDSVLIGISIYAVVLGVGTIVKNYFKNKPILSHYDRVLSIADTNHDNCVTCDEWATVYKALNIPYDALSPKELSTSQLEEFINKHEVEEVKSPK